MSNYLSVSDAAKMVKRNRTTLYKKITTGELSASKDKNGITRIEVSELLRVFDIPQSHVVVDSTVAQQSTGQQSDSKNDSVDKPRKKRTLFDRVSRFLD